MTLPVSTTGSTAHSLPGAVPAAAAKNGGSLPFADLVRGLVQDTNSQQAQVDESVKQLVTGETDSIHDVVLTASQADLAFRLMMEVRDRLISSYQKIMRMQM